MCYRDGKRAYPTEADARADATAPGRYRISIVTPAGRTDGQPFEIGIESNRPPSTDAAPKRPRSSPARRPAPWRGR